MEETDADSLQKEMIISKNREPKHSQVSTNIHRRVQTLIANSLFLIGNSLFRVYIVTQAH